jgi:ABC-type phosphate transport system ATPase subunit
MDKKIGFIGAGNMASTIINGLVNSFKDINNKIYVTDINKEKVEKLRDGLNINLCENNTELVKRCDIIFLAIKPNAYQSVLKEIKSYMNNEKLIISMMAGVTIDDIKQYFKQPVKIIRIMPNVGVTVNEGMIALNGGDNVTREEIDLAVELLSSIGRVDEIEEHLMDAVTNISETFKDLHENYDTTIIIISHQERILRLADQIILLADGKIKEVTDGEKIMADIAANTRDCMCGQDCRKGVNRNVECIG